MELIQRRRGLIGSKITGSRLPEEYQEIEYLEGQGAQFIPTSVRQRSGLRAKYRIMFTQHISDTQQVFATNNGIATKSLYFPYISNGRWYYGYDGAIDTELSVAANTIYEVDSLLSVGNQIVNIDGNTIMTGSNTTDISSTNMMYMYANGNPAVRRYAYARIYYFNVFDTVSDTQISKFVPCYRKLDSKPGMYDLVTKQFFTNQGTGEFIVGPDIN